MSKSICGVIAGFGLIIATSVMAGEAGGTVEAAASEAGTGLEEILVTAQRRSESLLSVPLAITAVTGDELARANIVNPTELVSVVPNISMAGGYGKSQPDIFIRGIGSAQNTANVASPVGIYLDDDYLAARSGHGLQLFDLERVEVLRGPQGTLFGRNTTGGAINVISRQPKLDGENGYAEVGYGNYNAAHVLLAGEATFIPNVLGVRVSGDYDRTDGTYRNTTGQREPNQGNNWATRVVVRYKPVDDLDMTFKAYNGHDNHAQIPVHSVGAGPGGVDPINGYSRAGLGFYDTSAGQIGEYVTDSWGFLANIKYRINDVMSVSSLTAYDGGMWAMNHEDDDSTPTDILDETYHVNRRQFNQELKLSVTTDHFNVVTGAYYGWDTMKIFHGLNIFFFNQALGNPIDPTLANGGLGLQQNYNQTRISKALFSQADYKFFDHWTATVGLRYTWDDVAVKNASADLSDYNGVPFAYTVGTAQSPLDPIHRDDKAPTGRVALTYTFDNRAIAYVSANHGYRSGALSGDFFLTPTQINFVKKEEINAYEIGSKGLVFDGRMSYATAIFLNKYQNQQLNDVENGLVVLLNAGKATTYGAELELKGQINHDLLARMNIGLLHTKYDELTLSGVNFDGNEMPFSPKFTGQLGVDWTAAHLGGGDLVFSPSASYTSKHFFAPNNNGPSYLGDTVGNSILSQGGYLIANAELSWTKGPISATLWANNLFQRNYLTDGYDLRAYGNWYLIGGDPRTYGARFRYSF